MDKLARVMHHTILGIFANIEQEIPELKGKCWGLKPSNDEVIVFYHPYGCETEMQYSLDQTRKLQEVLQKEEK